MGAFKRLILIVASISAILGVGYLTLYWLPIQGMAPAFYGISTQPWFFITLLTLIAITAIAIIVVLLWAIVTPGKASHLAIEDDGQKVDISKDALVSTVRHGIESNRDVKAEDIKVKIIKRKSPGIQVKCTIDPGRNFDLAALGMSVGASISWSVTNLTGYAPEKVRVNFTQPMKVDVAQPIVHQPIAPRAENPAATTTPTAPAL